MSELTEEQKQQSAKVAEWMSNWTNSKEYKRRYSKNLKSLFSKDSKIDLNGLISSDLKGQQDRLAKVSYEYDDNPDVDYRGYYTYGNNTITISPQYKESTFAHEMLMLCQGLKKLCFHKKK